MTPGSLLLGSSGQPFECGHEHGVGDRCLSFSYSPELFERVIADAGVHPARTDFRMLRLPPMRVLSPLLARAQAGLLEGEERSWEELAIDLAGAAARLDQGLTNTHREPDSGALARVTRVVRMIDRNPNEVCSLDVLSQEAGLSRYHFLRTFERLTGVTPHQYLLRLRLRQAAVRIQAEQTNILDIALDCGFGDLSNFIRGFRAEFGVSPRQYRKQAAFRSSRSQQLL